MTVDVDSETTVVCGSSFCSSSVAAMAAAVIADAAVTTAACGSFFSLSSVVDAAMALAAASHLPALSVCLSDDLARGYPLESPHIHSKSLFTGSGLWKNAVSHP